MCQKILSKIDNKNQNRKKCLLGKLSVRWFHPAPRRPDRTDQTEYRPELLYSQLSFGLRLIKSSVNLYGNGPGSNIQRLPGCKEQTECLSKQSL